MSDSSRSHQEGPDQRWGLVLLLAVTAWVAGAASEPFASAVEAVRSGQPLAAARLALASLPLLLGLSLLVFSRLATPRLRGLFLVFASAALTLAMADVAQRFLDPDEPIHLHFAWNLKSGLMPYRDFLTVRHQLWHFSMTPLLRIWDNDLQIIYWAKYLTMATTLTAVALSARLVARWGGEAWSLPILALSIAPLAAAGVEFRSDPAEALMIVIGLLLLQAGRPAWAGALVGGAYLVIQKALFHALALAIGYLLSSLSLRRWLRFAIPCACTASLYFVLAAALGVLSDYWRCCYVYAGAYAKSFQSASLLKSAAATALREELLASPLLWLLALLGGVQLARRREERWMPVATAMCLVFTLMTRIGSRQYILLTYLLVAILAAVALGKLRQRPATLAGNAPTFVLLMICFVALVRWAAQPLPGIDLTNAEIALAHLKPDQTYYGEEWSGHYAHPIFRPQASYFGQNQVMFSGWFRGAGVVPPQGDPADLSWLPHHPPKAMVFYHADREREALALLEKAGIHYRKLGSVLLRQD